METLREWRAERGMSRSQLASESGVSLQTIGKIEGDSTHRVHDKTALRISAALHVEIEDIEEFSAKDDRLVSIYGLIDPRDDSIRYIGQTRRDPKKRLREHQDEARTIYKHLRLSHWLTELDNAGLVPEIVVLAQTTERQSYQCEKEWVAEMLKRGESVTNCTYAGVPSTRIVQEQKERRDQFIASSPDPDIAGRRWDIMQFRKRYGITQQSLADMLGVDKSLISRWERGSRDPEPWVGLALQSLQDRIAAE